MPLQASIQPRDVTPCPHLQPGGYVLPSTRGQIPSPSSRPLSRQNNYTSCHSCYHLLLPIGVFLIQHPTPQTIFTPLLCPGIEHKTLSRYFSESKAWEEKTILNWWVYSFSFESHSNSRSRVGFYVNHPVSYRRNMKPWNKLPKTPGKNKFIVYQLCLLPRPSPYSP